LLIPTHDILQILEELGEDLPNGHERNIVATLRRSVELLDEDGPGFLRLASVLATEAIPADLVNDVFTRLGRKGPYAGSRAAEQAVRHSLAEQAAVRGGGWIVHGLVTKLLARHDMNQIGRARVRDLAIASLFDSLLTARNVQEHDRIRFHVAHASHLAAEQPTPRRQACWSG